MWLLDFSVLSDFYFFLRVRRPPRPTRPYTHCPYSPLCRSGSDVSAQKGRSASFFSDPRSAVRLNSPTCLNNACQAARNVGGLIPVVALNSYLTQIDRKSTRLNSSH